MRDNSPTLLANARFIAIEGPVGAGKSSLAERLSERLSAMLLRELPEQNPFLARFYNQPGNWNLAAQLNFLFQRIDQLGQLRDPGSNQRIVSDFVLAKDALFASLNLDDDELALYQRIASAMTPPDLPSPDLVIYLQARAETLLGRVRQRSQPAERGVTEQYLARVADCYARFFHDYDASPLFVVDAEVLNPVGADDDFELLFERLTQMRSHREYFAYGG